MCRGNTEGVAWAKAKSLTRRLCSKAPASACSAVKSLSNYSNTVVGILVMIPHLTGLVVMIVVSRSTDRKMERPEIRREPHAPGGLDDPSRSLQPIRN